jgi:hypothetical protein
MTNKEKAKFFEQRDRWSKAIRDSERSNARAVADNDFGKPKRPYGHIEPVQRIAHVGDLRVPVTIVVASFGQTKREFCDLDEAKVWVAAQREAWESEHAADFEKQVQRVEAKREIAKVLDALGDVLARFEESFTDEQASLLGDADALLAIAHKTINADGTTRTIIEAKDAAA